ncbi:MAG: peptidylprolyl isomerase [Oscillospiraceae bacterium]|nr:peptidylprolyl isomerase [Oscillospiraceae bacterium]
MKVKNIILGAILAVGCAFTATGCFDKTTPGNVAEIAVQDGDTVAEIEIEGYGVIKAKLFPDLAPMAVENFTLLADAGYYDGLKIHRVLPGHFMQGGSLNGDGTGGTALVDPSGEFDIETDKQARNFYGALGCPNVNGKNTTQFYIVNNKTPSVDYTQLDPAAFKTQADELTVTRDAIEDTESSEYAMLNAQIIHYTNLSDMISGATDEVKQKYNTVGGDPFLDGGYTVFGQMYEGFDVLDSIANVKVVTNNIGEESRPAEDIVISSVKVYKVTVSTAESGENSSSGSSAPNSSTTSEPDSSSTAETDAATIETGENAA